MTDGFLLLLGLVLLISGGEFLVRGASRLARSLGVSPLIIGMTIVSFGTSAPEMAVNLLAAFKDSPGLSFGNIVGSNLANIGLIAGGAAMMHPMVIHSLVLLRELPMMLLATAVALVVAADGLLGRSGEDVLDRSDGLLLLLVFGVFVYYTVLEGLRQRSRTLESVPGSGVPAVLGAEEHSEPAPPPRPSPGSTRSNVLLILAGAVLLVLGARLTVLGASGLARGLGVSEVLIGLTIVAVGTSLPELAASLVAAFRNQADIAIGNVVGSNIFNLLLVGGVCATARPIRIPEGGLMDLTVAFGFSLIFWGVAATQDQRISRGEGALLLAIYVGYLLQRTAPYWT